MYVKGYLLILILFIYYGGTASTMPSLITDQLGTKNAGFVVSLVMIGFGISSIGTPFLARAVSLSTTFILAGAIAVISVVLVLLLPKVKKA